MVVNRSMIALVVALVLVMPAFAHATKYEARAKVVKVEPIIKEIRVSTPRRECWDEPLYPERRRYHEGRYYRSQYSPAGVVLGGIIGGVVGNQFGKGSGNVAATLAGGLLGASIAHGSQASHSYSRNYQARYYEEPSYRRACRRVRDYHTEERVTGYWVHFRYAGKTQVAYMPYKPGKTIKVGVNLRPVY